jgi:hypothetical protein
MAIERLLTPQQELFIANYTNPKSKTFGNARATALDAGYSQEYADNIMSLMPEWLSENIGKRTLVIKAEKVLNKTLDYDVTDADGKVDTALLSIQNSTAKFVAERLNKNDYSARTEQTGADGAPLVLGINYVKPNGDNTSTNA